MRRSRSESRQCYLGNNGVVIRALSCILLLFSRTRGLYNTFQLRCSNRKVLCGFFIRRCDDNKLCLLNPVTEPVLVQSWLELSVIQPLTWPQVALAMSQIRPACLGDSVCF